MHLTQSPRRASSKLAIQTGYAPHASTRERFESLAVCAVRHHNTLNRRQRLHWVKMRLNLRCNLRHCQRYHQRHYQRFAPPTGAAQP
jgi:hypothetical protein